MTNLKYFSLNGTNYSITNNFDLTIENLLCYFNYNPKLLVVEYNNSICNKKYWNTIKIMSKDKIEIITIVGGG